jgi:hypothetical protein
MTSSHARFSSATSGIIHLPPRSFMISSHFSHP